MVIVLVNKIKEMQSHLTTFLNVSSVFEEQKNWHCSPITFAQKINCQEQQTSKAMYGDPKIKITASSHFKKQP